MAVLFFVGAGVSLCNMILHSGDNVGGVAQYELCHVDDLVSFYPVRFKPGRYWQCVRHVPETGTLADEELDTDNGVTYSYSGSFKRQYPSERDELDMSRYMGKCTIWRITDMNRRIYLLGTPENPVSLSRSGNRGARPSDMAHNEFKFSVVQVDRAMAVLS